MKSVFADTFYWIALTNPSDQYFNEVQRFDDVLSNNAICTTEEVLAEVLAFFAGDTWLRTRAARTVREILADPGVRVIPQSHESFLAGLELYTARPDKGYSLTDCISMLVMRSEGITEILTNDHHFLQEGFRTVFRSL